MRTGTLLVDAIRFQVDWNILNEYGDVMQMFVAEPTEGMASGQPGGGHVRNAILNPILGDNVIEPFMPPVKGADGYRVQVLVPIQSAYHDWSVGVTMHVYVERGTRLEVIAE